VIYFIIAVVAVDRFKVDGFKSRWQFIFFSQLLPIGLVVIAYFTLIKGTIFPTDGSLLKSLGSVDAFFTEILGPLFFLLLFLVFAATNWFIFHGKREIALNVLTVGLVIYYAVGIPSYYRELMNYQTYPYLAKQISRMLPPPDPKSGQADRVSVFLPNERAKKSNAEIYNGLRTHGFPRTIIEGYSEDAVDQMATDIGFIIILLPDDLERNDLPVLEINGEQYQIIPIDK
jgi:hypothetical protein